MVNETALIAINSGSNAQMNGELAMLAELIPKSDATGLAQTPTQAPLLQHDNKTGAADVNPPVNVLQIDFFDCMLNSSLNMYWFKNSPTTNSN